MKEIIRTKHVLKLTDENVVVCILKKNKKTSYCLFFLQEAVLKANARTKKWIVYSVVFGSIAVIGVSGILVGLYLSGNLQKGAPEEVSW